MKAAVLLPPDHPGAHDPAYLARRIELADGATGIGAPPAYVTYTAAEDEVWQTVSTALAPLHEEYAVGEYLSGAHALALPTDRVPQLAVGQ